MDGETYWPIGNMMWIELGSPMHIKSARWKELRCTYKRIRCASNRVKLDAPRKLSGLS
jgi:hypothetical protein